jgi:hypothetical protein
MSTLDELRGKLVEAVDDLDRPRAADLVQCIVAHLDAAPLPADTATAEGLVRDLRRKRYHDLVTQVAEALIRNGAGAPAVRRQYVQSLLDRGVVDAGIAVADRLLAEVGPSSDDGVEIRGLLGRACKDTALATAHPGRRSAALHRAVEAYLGPYREEPSRWWHGINACALLALAEREGMAYPHNVAAKDLGAEILAAIERQDGGLASWDHATAAEAALATGDADTAMTWLMRYLVEARGDAFALGSTLRQLTAVWQLRPDSPPGDRLVAPLQAALLRAEGGAVEVPADEWQAGIVHTGFEALFGRERYQDLVWFQHALDRCRGVGRVDDEYDDAAGTGFLVTTASLGIRNGPPLFVTNSHVISREGLAALKPDQARVTFTALDSGPEAYRVADVVWESPPDQLDCTLVALSDLPPQCQGLALAGPPVLAPPRKQRAYVIGHPARRRRPQFSIRDNFLLDLDDRLVHYRSPTEPGSSGSPVFNEEWDVFALHHCGLPQLPKLHGEAGVYEANEGVRVDAIAAACREALG